MIFKKTFLYKDIYIMHIVSLSYAMHCFFNVLNDPLLLPTDIMPVSNSQDNNDYLQP